MTRENDVLCVQLFSMWNYCMKLIFMLPTTTIATVLKFNIIFKKIQHIQIFNFAPKCMIIYF
jgi:hypothetical protein